MTQIADRPDRPTDWWDFQGCVRAGRKPAWKHGPKGLHCTAHGTHSTWSPMAWIWADDDGEFNEYRLFWGCASVGSDILVA